MGAVTVKVVVFDIGGTLMEYRNMPYVWIDYYHDAFCYVSERLGLELTTEEIAQSVEVLRQFNPRVKYREKDYTPEYIFTQAASHWHCSYDLQAVIGTFFENMKLTPHIYEDTLPVLERLKSGGVTICALTDVATGMPDALHKSYIPQLLPYFAMYVSSVSCGWRKPNRRGLDLIAERFGVPVNTLTFVGDEEKDIRTAQNAGCRSVLIDRRGSGFEYGQDASVTDLYGLLGSGILG